MCQLCHKFTFLFHQNKHEYIFVNVHIFAQDDDSCAFVLRLDMANYMQDWILSEKKAPGLIVAHGHFGRSYQRDLDKLYVFTSQDGGWTWVQVQ